MGNYQDRVKRLFEATLDKERSERALFLDGLGSADLNLRKDVESLLASKEGDEPATREKSTATKPLSPDTKSPDRIGPYHILRQIGEGGMGVVYEAEQEKPVRRKVALKLIKWGMDTKAVVARFESERQALALMNHPNIATVFDAGATDEGRPYFAMEYVHGIPITEYCDKHRLTIKERLELFIQACEGVQHAHQKGIIHRDIKPSNVLVAVQHDKSVPKIIDFGVAKATSQRLTEHSVATELGQLIGTPEYMSPEQAEMTNLDIDTRTDVYSLGVLLYELLVGTQPFNSKELREVGLIEIQKKLREEEPPRPSTRVRGLGEASTASASNRQAQVKALEQQLRGDLDLITMKALEKDRTRRYSSPADLVADVRRHLNLEPVLANPPSALYRAKKFIVRHKAATAVMTMIFTVILGSLLAIEQQRKIAVEAREEAEQRRGQAEELVRFMLVDLHEKLAPIGSLHILGDIGDKSLSYLKSIPVEDLTDAELMSRVKALRLLGEVRVDQGDLRAALVAFEDSHLNATSLAARDAEDEDSQYELAHAEYWLGTVRSRQGQFEPARQHYRRYLDIAEAMLVSDPANMKWDRERAYANFNIGTVYQEEGKLENALQMFSNALEIEKELDRKENGSTDARLNLAVTYNRVGQLLERLGRLEEARQLYLEDLSIKKTLVAEDPSHAVWLDHLGMSHNYLGGLLQQMGQVHEALEHLEADVEIANNLSQRDPGNAKWQRGLAAASRQHGLALLEADDPIGATKLIRSSLETLERSSALDPTNLSLRAQLAASHIAMGKAHLSSGKVNEAEAAATRAVNMIQPEPTVILDADAAPAKPRLLGEAYLLRGEALLARGRTSEANAAWARGIDVLQPTGREIEEADTGHLVVLASLQLHLDAQHAESVVQELTRRGYRGRAFVELCERKGLDLLTAN